MTHASARSSRPQAQAGLYVLEGKAVYRLNQNWGEVEAGDFMWSR
ncbi:hypothetical protein C266_21059 [Pandoraea sp. SD6-2]|nr:hypothetical protein C266_21059 [Pandoraea sp. SD6-2]